MKEEIESSKHIASQLRDLGYQIENEAAELLGVLNRIEFIGSGDNDIRLTKNFNLREFACRHCGAVRLYMPLAQKLQDLRNAINKPLRIGSGYRCEIHNATVSGSAKNSQHIQGRAADIRADGLTPEQLAEKAEIIGFIGIGIYPNRGFVHLDLREGGPVKWVNESASPNSA